MGLTEAAESVSFAALISRMMSRLSHAASVNSSRSASSVTWRFISGDTRAFTTSVQFMGPNVTQKPLAGYPAFLGKRGRYSNRPSPRILAITEPSRASAIAPRRVRRLMHPS
jgi:hypothetical protein